MSFKKGRKTGSAAVIFSSFFVCPSSKEISQEKEKAMKKEIIY